MRPGVPGQPSLRRATAWTARGRGGSRDPLTALLPSLRRALGRWLRSGRLGAGTEFDPCLASKDGLCAFSEPGAMIAVRCSQDPAHPGCGSAWSCRTLQSGRSLP